MGTVLDIHHDSVTLFGTFWGNDCFDGFTSAIKAVMLKIQACNYFLETPKEINGCWLF